MTNITRRLGIVTILLAISTQAFAAPTSFTGSLTSANGGLVGTGSWLDKTLLKPSQQSSWTAPALSWTVFGNPDNTWHYTYTLSVFRKDVSHFIVEASPSFGRSNIWGASGPFGKIEVSDFQPGGSSNPGMPNEVHGIKFDETWGTLVSYSFTSNRAPIWGDFYAKSGISGGENNAIWNAGFGLFDVDPSVPVSSGSYLNHVLVPDTTDVPNTTPEPASLVSLAAGMMGLLGLRGRRRG